MKVMKKPFIERSCRKRVRHERELALVTLGKSTTARTSTSSGSRSASSTECASETHTIPCYRKARVASCFLPLMTNQHWRQAVCPESWGWLSNEPGTETNEFWSHRPQNLQSMILQHTSSATKGKGWMCRYCQLGWVKGSACGPRSMWDT